MLLFILKALSLSIHNLNIKVTNFSIYRNESTSILSQIFLKKFFDYDLELKNNFIYKNNDLSEFFAYSVKNENEKITEHRYFIIKNDKQMTLNKYDFSINYNCRLNEINPRCKQNCPNDNIPILKIENIHSYSKTIWAEYLSLHFIQNIWLTIDSLKIILKQNNSTLKAQLKRLPFLFFDKHLNNFYEIFEIVLHTVENNTKITYKLLKDALQMFTINYEDNMIMQKYHELHGFEINEKSFDFCLSLLFTDLANIIGHLNVPSDYIFQLYNFIECKEFLYGKYAIGLDINFNIFSIPKDEFGKSLILVYDGSYKRITKFNLINDNENFVVLLDRVFCIDNDINEVKIKFKANEKMYESEFIDIKDYVFE